MNGYIARKGDRWYAVVYEGVDPATGKERRRWVPAGTDRAEAETLAAHLGAREEERRSGRGSQMTVAGFLLHYWLPAKQLQLAAVTFAGYQRMVRLHVIPHIGHVVLPKLQPDQLEKLYSLLLEEGRSDDKGGSHRRRSSKSTSSCGSPSGMRYANTCCRTTRPPPPTPHNTDATQTEHTGCGPPTNSAASSTRPLGCGTTPRFGSPPTPGCDDPRYSASGGTCSGVEGDDPAYAPRRTVSGIEVCRTLPKTSQITP